MTSVAFTGDIAFSKYFADSFDDPNLISGEIVDFLTSSDYVVPNVEGALTSGAKKRGDASTPAHASDPRSIFQLLKIRGKIWNLSNNHTLDCGEEGLKDTIALAQANECQVFGAGFNAEKAIRPVIIDRSGGIGLFGVCYKKLFAADTDKAGIIHWDDRARIKAAVKEIKKSCRWCVMVVHGGEEFSSMPLPFVRKKYLQYLKYGADVIVAHHPHVPQNYELVGEKAIFYSLGNFIFDTDYQRIQKNTDKGILLKLHFTENSYSWDYLPCQIDRNAKRVTQSACPPIFRNINQAEYRKLIPMATKTFLEDYKRAKIFLKPYMADYSVFQWAIWYVKNKGIGPALMLLWGYVRSLGIFTALHL